MSTFQISFKSIINNYWIWFHGQDTCYLPKPKPEAHNINHQSDFKAFLTSHCREVKDKKSHCLANLATWFNTPIQAITGSCMKARPKGQELNTIWRKIKREVTAATNAALQRNVSIVQTIGKISPFTLFPKTKIRGKYGWQK